MIIPTLKYNGASPVTNKSRFTPKKFRNKHTDIIERFIRGKLK